MERSIRIGKDFNVRWSINKRVDGERQPYELAGKDLVLQYRTPYGIKEATEWKVVGNTIVWTFRGKEQKDLGSYELILTENGGKDGMVTVDTRRAFKLVAHSCEETEGSGCDIVIEDVVLESEVAFAPVVTHDDTAIWEALASLEQLIEDLQNMKIDREADDYYPKLSVGLADNLAGVDVVDSEINFRRSGGGAITDGVARIESIKGNSVVWNQLVNGEDSLILSNSHKYMTIIGSVAAIKTNIATLDVAEGDRVYDLTKMFGSGNEPTTIEEFNARIPMGVDLSAYNEGEVIHMDVQSVESVGVNQWDEEWESGGYNTTTGNKEEGANFIRTKNLIQVFGGQSYYITLNGKTCYAWLYDSEQNFVKYTSISSSNVLSIPSNCAYIVLRLGSGSEPITTYNHDICVNISDASINGKYYPYIKRVEDLAVIRKYFPQGMKSAGTAHDEIRYNKASGKWEKVEAVGVRTYQEGDADNAAYLTDGKVTCYPLAEPIVTELDEADQFKDLDYQVWNAGTEKAIAKGKSAPLAADITYGFNAIGKIKELESLVAALRAKVGI